MRTAGILAFTAIASAAHSQGSTFTGRVLSDSGVALAGAEVVLNGPQNSQRTNASGEFKFIAVPAGRNIVGVRTPGFAPLIDTIEFADAGEIRREFRLARIQTELPEVPVTATLLDRKLFEFYERRRFGIGRFLDSAEFAETRGTRTSDRLTKLPGLMIQRGQGSQAIVVNTRTRSRGEPGPNSWCRALVWVDNVNLGTGYNVNELDPSIIAAVEWYAGEASIPVRFAVPRTARRDYCGVLVIWLR